MLCLSVCPPHLFHGPVSFRGGIRDQVLECRGVRERVVQDMGVVQSGALGANRIRWILASAGGGLLLGLASLLGCTLFGTTFYSVVLFGQDVSGVCVNIGLTLPRLQSSEPLFALTAATVVAHLFGWLAYSAVTTWAFPTNTI